MMLKTENLKRTSDKWHQKTRLQNVTALLMRISEH